MNHNYIFSIFLKDRVGIIADVSKAILELDGNLGDLNQAVLGGYFTMIFTAAFKIGIQENILQQQILSKFNSPEDNITISVREFTNEDTIKNFDLKKAEEHKYVMTVTADNREGIVSETSAFCKNNNINIINLSTALTDNKYIMMYLLDLTNVKSIEVIRNKIKVFADNEALKVVLQHNDIFRATNEIKYYK